MDGATRSVEPRGRSYWQQVAEARLPSVDAALDRNRAITAAYASLYRALPARFEWAGVAAFASFHAKIYVRRYERRGRTLGSNEARERDRIFQTLNLLRQTNNRIYRDIAWAHEAYASGGLAELDPILSAESDHHLMREGFRKLDEADMQHSKGASPEDVEATVSQASELLLRHEQLHTVQPQCDKIDRGTAFLLSLTTDTDFDADHTRTDHATYSSFFRFMLASPGMLIRTGSYPNIKRFDHRWHWISRAVIPLWQKTRLSTDLDVKFARMLNDAPP